MSSRLVSALVFLLAMVFIALGVFWPPVQLKRPLTVAVGTWPGVEPLALADELGYLSEQVTIMEMPWPSATMRAFENGAADAAVITLDELLRLGESNHDLRAVLVFDFSLSADGIVARQGINSIKDLKGRRVGVGLTSVGAYVLRRALAEEGMTFADLEIVALNVAESERAFEDQQLDAVVTSDPFRFRLLQKGAVELFNSSRIPGEIIRILVVRSNTLEEETDTLQQIVDSHFRAVEAYQEGLSPDLMSALARRQNLSVEDFRQEFARIDQPDRKRNAILLGSGPGNLDGTLRKIRDFMVRHKVVSPHDDRGQWMDDRLCQPPP